MLGLIGLCFPKYASCKRNLYLKSKSFKCIKGTVFKGEWNSQRSILKCRQMMQNISNLWLQTRDISDFFGVSDFLYKRAIPDVVSSVSLFHWLHQSFAEKWCGAPSTQQPEEVTRFDARCISVSPWHQVATQSSATFYPASYDLKRCYIHSKVIRTQGYIRVEGLYPSLRIFINVSSYIDRSTTMALKRIHKVRKY